MLGGDGRRRLSSWEGSDFWWVLAACQRREFYPGRWADRQEMRRNLRQSRKGKGEEGCQRGQGRYKWSKVQGARFCKHRGSARGTFASPVPEEKRRRQGESKQDRSASHLGQQPLSFLVKRRQRKRPGERRFSLANGQARGSGGQAALPTAHLHFKQPVCFISSLAYSPCAEKQSIKRDLAPGLAPPLNIFKVHD